MRDHTVSARCIWTGSSTKNMEDGFVLFWMMPPGNITPIREVITDHGSHFYANKRNKKGEAKHSFEEYCKQREIKQTLCKYNHPQSNGKMEKWFDTYNRHRDDFDSIQEFVDWYNRIRPHMSLNFDELETPEQAFYRKCDDIIFGNFVLMMESLLEEQI